MEYTGYFMRVQAYDGYADKIRGLRLVTDYEAIVAVKHKGSTGENAHYHMVVKTRVKDQAFRVRMRKVFDQGKGNEHMSIKAWDGNIDAISYMFHEQDAQLIEQHGVTDETIEKAKTRNEEVQRKVEEAKQRASWRLEDEVFDQVKGTQATQDEIAKRLILTSLRSGKYMPNDYLLKSMTYRIEFRLLEGDLDKEDAYANSVVQRVFHRYD